MKSIWKEQATYIYVFNVGRGLSVFIRTSMNHGILYDLGCSDDFSPFLFIEENLMPHLIKLKHGEAEFELAQVIVSHPHSDHMSEIDKLGKSLKKVNLLTCPHDKESSDEKVDFSRIKNIPGTEGLLETYKNLYKDRNLPLQTVLYDGNTYVPGVEYGIYYMRPPKVAVVHDKDDLKYANGLSLLFYYRFKEHSILIPGDITPEVFDEIMNERNGLEKRYSAFDPTQRREHPDWHEKTGDQPSLKHNLGKYGLTIYLAPHHGLESGYFSELGSYLKNGKPQLNVISEKRHWNDNDGNIHSGYSGEDASLGLDVMIGGVKKWCNSVNTSQGYHYLIAMDGTGTLPRVYGEKDPINLLGKI